MLQQNWCFHLIPVAKNNVPLIGLITQITTWKAVDQHNDYYYKSD